MLSRTISLVIKGFCLSCLLLLLACNNSEKGKSWNVFSEAIVQEMEHSTREVSISDLAELFFKKNMLLRELVTTCENNPAIRRVGVKDGEVSFYGSGHSTSDFKLVIEMTKSALSELSATSVDCGRRGDYAGNPLAIVSFVMYASGLSISGSSSGIVYKTEWSQNNNPVTDEQIESRGYTQLDRDGWYIFRN